MVMTASFLGSEDIYLHKGHKSRIQLSMKLNTYLYTGALQMADVMLRCPQLCHSWCEYHCCLLHVIMSMKFHLFSHDLCGFTQILATFSKLPRTQKLSYPLNL